MLPFTPDQFFGVFAEYNRAFAPMAGGLWVATLSGIVATWREPKRWGTGLSYFVAALWIWNAVAYHALLFSRINRAAWFFSLLFLLQSFQFARAARRRSIAYFAAQGARLWVAMALVGYGMAYPLLNLGAGHPYPATPTFGLPCPTAIVTIGLLLGARYAPTMWLPVLPVVWAAIGGSAAWLLGVWPDYVLLAAGLALGLVSVADLTRSPRTQAT